MEAIVDDIEAELQQRATREVTSAEIGEMVLGKLQAINEVAFVRFASVYRQFQGIRDFAETLSQLQDERSDRPTGTADNGQPSTYVVSATAP
jgi:transcriptional repressor NrdR